MLTYMAGQWGKTSTLLDDARTAQELYEQMKKLGFLSYDELLCRTGVLKLYKRKWLGGKKTFEFDFCCELSISGYIHMILLPDLSDVLRFLQDVDAHPKHMEVTLEGFSQEVTTLLEAWVGRLEEPSVFSTKGDELMRTLQNIAASLEQLVTAYVPHQARGKGDAIRPTLRSTPRPAPAPRLSPIEDIEDPFTDFDWLPPTQHIEDIKDDLP